MNNCLACGSETMNLLDLGKQPLANNLISKKSDNFKTYPLGLVFCPTCSHSQLNYFVDPKILFSNYFYMSSTSELMKGYFSEFAKTIKDNFGSEALIIDIASNDGAFLDALKEEGMSPLGIDPAKNLVSFSREKGHEVICDFFPSQKLSERRFDLITGLNVFAHNPSPRFFLNEAKKILKKKGLIFIQVSQSEMLNTGQFDTIYHEHFSFFTVNSMKVLCEKCGLKLLSWQIVSVHDKSTIFQIGFKESKAVNLHFPCFKSSPEKILFSSEISLGDINSFYLNFKKIALNRMEEVANICSKYRNLGFDIVLAGVAAKALTFFHAASYHVDYFLDETPLKIGKYIPGTGKKIRKFEEINLSKKALVVVGAWNGFEEIKRKLDHISHQKLIYLKYFPDLELITNDYDKS